MQDIKSLTSWMMLGAIGVVFALLACLGAVTFIGAQGDKEVLLKKLSICGNHSSRVPQC